MHIAINHRKEFEEAEETEEMQKLVQVEECGVKSLLVQGDVAEEDIIDMVNTAVEHLAAWIFSSIMPIQKSVHPMKYLPKILITFCL